MEALLEKINMIKKSRIMNDPKQIILCISNEIFKSDLSNYSKFNNSGIDITINNDDSGFNLKLNKLTSKSIFYFISKKKEIRSFSFRLHLSDNNGGTDINFEFRNTRLSSYFYFSNSIINVNEYESFTTYIKSYGELISTYHDLLDYQETYVNMSNILLAKHNKIYNKNA